MKNAFFCMQNHAPYACTLKKRGPPEKKPQNGRGEVIKNPRREGDGSGGINVRGGGFRSGSAFAAVVAVTPAP